jgi:signal transduction histidine kinase
MLENDRLVLQQNKVLRTYEKAKTPTGSEHTYEIVKFPLHAEDELLIGGWAIDITEEIALRKSVNTHLEKLQASERELKAALEKEHQLNDMKSRFVSMASHEFRTPLSTILSSIYLLEKYTTTEQQSSRIKHSGKIKEAVHHMNELLEDFLSIGKLEEGKIAIHFSEVDLQELVKDIITEMEPLKKRGQDIIVHSCGESKIWTDEKIVKIMIVNLLSNALKFSSENKKVNITLAVAAGKVSITVHDEGIGISEADQRHLFESFYRGKNAQNIQGTGLGLHIVRRYVQLLRGDIKLVSDIDKGTTVSLSFSCRNNDVKT